MTKHVNPKSETADAQGMDNQGIEALIQALSEQGVTSPDTHAKVRGAGFSEEECAQLLSTLLSDDDDED